MKTQPEKLNRLAELVVSDTGFSPFDDDIVAYVINPKTLEPLKVYSPDGFSVTLRTSKETKIGEGFVDPNEQGFPHIPNISAYISGYPRFHTPGGVGFLKGGGYGTCLYFGAALVAGRSLNQVNQRYFTEPKHAGISSGPDASSESKTWWKKAVAKGLATAINTDITVLPIKTRKELDLDPDDSEYRRPFTVYYIPEQNVLKSGVVLSTYKGLVNRRKDVYLNMNISNADELDIEYFENILRGLGATKEELARFLKGEREPAQAQAVANLLFVADF